jgi:hypothetical protein
MPGGVAGAQLNLAAPYADFPLINDGRIVLILPGRISWFNSLA